MKKENALNDLMQFLSIEGITGKEKKIAEIVIENCKRNKIFCIDLYNKSKFSENSFYDLVHTTPEGSNIIAEIVYNDFNKFLKKN